MRRLMVGLAAAVLLPFGAGAATAAPLTWPVAGIPRPADLDADRLRDDLESRLATLRAAERVDVIVRLAPGAGGAAAVERLSQRVGGIAVRDRFSCRASQPERRRRRSRRSGG